MSSAFFAVHKKIFGGFDERGKPARAACRARDAKEESDKASRSLSSTYPKQFEIYRVSPLNILLAAEPNRKTFVVL
jgi:hypothetical protein